MFRATIALEFKEVPNTTALCHGFGATPKAAKHAAVENAIAKLSVITLPRSFTKPFELRW